MFEPNFVDTVAVWLLHNYPEFLGDFKSAVHYDDCKNPEYYAPAAHNWLSKHPKLKKEFSQKYSFVKAISRKK